MVRHDGHYVSEATVLRRLRDQYQRERRKLAERRRAAFAEESTGPNQAWQLDFSEFETTSGETWQIAGCRDYWPKFEHRWHLSPTANQYDVIEAVELALADCEAISAIRSGTRVRAMSRPGRTGLVTIVTDNGGPSGSRRSSHSTPNYGTSAPASVRRGRAAHASASSGC